MILTKAIKPQKNKFRFFLLTTLTVLILISSCEKRDFVKIMEVTTNTASNITPTTATVSGTIVDLGSGITTHGHCWSTSQNPTTNNNKTEKGSRTSAGNFTSNLTGLSPGIKYYVRAYATNSIGTAYGNEISFATSAYLPTVSIGPATDITYNSATIPWSLSNKEGAIYTARGVCWSTLQNPTIHDNYTTISTCLGGADPGLTMIFISSITGLSPGTTYYVRAYATTSSLGTAYSREVSFTTKATIPTVTTISASSITENSAESGGNITDDGGATVTARGVCWSTSSNPTITDSYTSDGNGTGGFTSSITGLDQNTTYYVRAYATNSVGTAYGNEVSFTISTKNIAFIYKTDPTGGNDFSSLFSSKGFSTSMLTI